MLVLLAGFALPARAASGVPPIKHVFLIMLENKGYDETFGAQSPAPYLGRTLPAMGALVPNYYGVTHLSLGNYIALISGQGSNPTTQSDCQVYTNMLPGMVGADGQAIGTGCVYPGRIKTIADQLQAAGLSWRGYMEDMGNDPASPATCRHPTLGAADTTQLARRGDQYAARHNPFVYFHSLLDSGACARDDVPLDRLPADLATATRTPSLSFITPNLCNDGHDAPCVSGQPGGLVSADAFLRTWVPRIMSSAAYRDGGLIAVLFDESDGSDASACCGEPKFPNTVTNGGPHPGPGGGRMGAVLLSPFIQPGTVDSAPLNHFSMLRSVEDVFGLAHLGYAALPGLSPLGRTAFTCYQPSPRARRGRLRRGTEIKLATIQRGASGQAVVEVELWHGGRVSLQVSRPRRPFGPPASARAISQCQLLRVTLRLRHGRVRVNARAFGGVEQRTLSF